MGIAGVGTAAAAAVYGATQLLSDNEDKDSANAAALLTPGSGPLRGPSNPQVSTLNPFADPLRLPPTLKLSTSETNEIKLVAKKVRLHSQLPPTPMWTYEGYYPGPTIEVESRQKVRIAWANELTGTTPVKAVYVPPSGPPPGFAAANTPGAPGAAVRPEIAGLTPWISVHVHGGKQDAVADGPADYGVGSGGAQISEYPNDTTARHLFYHDHTMPITAVNVAAGLIGNYIVRDPNEERLGLPSGKYEIPLMLSDINFDTDSNGLINGQILVKRVQAGPTVPGAIQGALPSTGPFTMVNGVVWPYLEVEAGAYRFRMVNGSSSRAYQLVILDEATGKPVTGAIRVIGTDGGLLDEAHPVDEALTLAPAERVDLVVDFTGFPNKKLRLVNTIPSAPAGTPAPRAGMPFPEVMQFRVGQGGAGFRPPAKLSDFKRITAGDVPKDVVERFVMLASSPTGMPSLYELMEAGSGAKAGPGIVEVALPGGMRTFRIAARKFEDTTNFFGASGSWEKWTFLNVAPTEPKIMHPMHIHLMDFQLIERRTLDPSGLDVKLGGTTKPISFGAPAPIAVTESGWKDTVRVAPNEMVTIAGQFGTVAGRVVYHCHILDHEDEGMMRPLVVLPSAVLTIQNMMMKMMDHVAPEPPATHLASSTTMAGMDHG